MPTIGEGVIPGGTPLRRCDTDLPFSTRSNKDPHKAGQVMSGALWEVRRTLGAEVSDPLAMMMLTQITPTGWLGTTKFTDMYVAIVAADRALFNGAHENALQTIFRRRGYM